jgi:hypothetical protein
MVGVVAAGLGPAAVAAVAGRERGSRSGMQVVAGSQGKLPKARGLNGVAVQAQRCLQGAWVQDVLN